MLKLISQIQLFAMLTFKGRNHYDPYDAKA